MHWRVMLAGLGLVLFSLVAIPQAVGARQAQPGCDRRVSATEWGRLNQSGNIDNGAGPTPRMWNAVDSCVEDGHRLMFRDGFTEDEFVHVGQWRHSDSEEFSQAWGFDIGAVRRSQTSSGDWTWSFYHPGTDPETNGNGAWVIYGKPVHAISSGWVVRCWRNAPENPVPPAVERRGNRVPGSGNYVMIQESDGDRVFYAHAIPGSIPSEICPHNNALFSRPSSDTIADQDPEAVVPPEQRVWVDAGTYLMRVGNSGQSSGPHLHVHKHRLNPSVQPVAIGFSEYYVLRADVVPQGWNWNMVSNQPWPPGPFVIRINDGTGSEIAAVPARRGAQSWVDGMARYGTNIGDRLLLARPEPAQCERACVNNPNCRSWTYVRPGWQAEQAVCWMKSDAPEPVPDECCSTGDVPG